MLPEHGIVDKEELPEIGAVASKSDKVIFLWHCGGHLQGIICSHTDDFCWDCTFMFKKYVIDVIKKKFKIGQEE